MTRPPVPRIEAIIISSAHNYVGHYGKPPGDHPGVHCERVRLLAGRGIEGDRYSAREPGHPKQITFFDVDVLAALARELGQPVPPEAVRRNVFVRGVDLNALIGHRFTLQGTPFEGTVACRPCFWMDQAVAPGAEAFLENRGGLRARILRDGILSVGDAPLTVEPEA